MNDDLISRQAAIDKLKEHRALYCDNTPDTFSILFYAEKIRVDELDTAIATLVNLPSAQPEIEPKTGRWIPYRCDMYECSVCQRIHTSMDVEGCDAEYCPHCGAKMEGEET